MDDCGHTENGGGVCALWARLHGPQFLFVHGPCSVFDVLCLRRCPLYYTVRFVDVYLCAAGLLICNTLPMVGCSWYVREPPVCDVQPKLLSTAINLFL